MRKAVRSAILMATLFVATTGAWAQSPAKDEKASGSISGTITINGKPARGIKVVAIQGNLYERGPAAIDYSDESGRYELKALPPGLCRVTVDAESFTIKDKAEDYSLFGKNIEIDGGEKIEGIDFDLMPGAVITGRVTEADGRPIINETVEVVPFRGGKDYDDAVSGYAGSDTKLRARTDDRGVYRAYGLPASRYLVRAGDRSLGRIMPSFGRLPLPRTYHADATDNAKPGVVEVAAGGETADRSQAAAWRAAGRAALRREAEAAGAQIDLKPCQRVKDYSIPYRQPSRATGLGR